MHSLRCGPDAAFAVLVSQSSNENRKLRDIAEEIVSRQAGSNGPPAATRAARDVRR
ncbi:MAG: ANTAR domain-containing protein [Aquihabitans sp.]